LKENFWVYYINKQLTFLNTPSLHSIYPRQGSDRFRFVQTS